MDPDFRQALATGYERMAAWSELLDRINVFPVADGDTGRNLAGTLAPLRRAELPPEELVPALLLGARGNSGNIGARFLEGFLVPSRGSSDGPPPLLDRCQRGSELARQAVAEPKPGTMLTFFEALARGLAEHPVDRQPEQMPALLDLLEHAVRQTTSQLPRLREAGVVDAGALGMHVFFEGFLNRLLARPAEELRDVALRFPGLASFDAAKRLAGAEQAGFCIDVVLRATAETEERLAGLAALGEDVVVLRHGDCVKLHLHVRDPALLRRQLDELGSVVRWAADDLARQTRQFARPTEAAAVHLVCDAAGSLTREDALELGLTLLDSYVHLGSLCVPETCLQPADLYAAMRSGVKVSTSQASVFERHQHYRRLVGQHERVLYLCVGSFYTGNFDVVSEWQREHDPGKVRLTVLDTGAASGRLGVIAIATARFARTATSADAVVAFARRAIAASREYIFLDRLSWLAAGGRLSKTSAFFGDLLHFKPVVSPTAEGAKKVAVLRRGSGQLAFALERLAESIGPEGKGLIMLEFSDNRDWLAAEVAPAVAAACPQAELRLQPFSLTSGAHMGPGTWAVAMLPETVRGRDGDRE